jgi:hypothetical protein
MGRGLDPLLEVGMRRLLAIAGCLIEMINSDTQICDSGIVSSPEASKQSGYDIENEAN